MRTRARNPFITVTTSGLLLPVDLLTRIVDGDPNLPGLSPKDYHLRSSERLNEAASRAWNECLAAWKSFRKKFAALPASDAGTTLSRDEWLLPLFQELGYGRLQPKRAVQIESREYPISHGWENHVPIHLISARYPIDRRTQGAAGAATRAPYSLMQEFLNRSNQHRWGFVSNGLKLYLLHDNAALARAANVEFDLEAMMDGEVYADFMLLFLLCHQSRVEIQPTPIATVTLDRKTGKAKKPKATSQKKVVTDDDAESADGDEFANAEEESIGLGPENCWLERWANQADQQGTRAREKLRDGVEAAIRAFGAGFLTTKGNQELRERMRSGELSTQDYYRQLLRLVYRLLMLLVAEEKKTENGANLFHPPGTPPQLRDRYTRFYSVSRIRTLAYERRGTAHTDLYESLKVLFLKLREGYAPLGIPGMGSFLFSHDSTLDLDDAFLANQDLLDAFRNLCYTEDTSGRGGSIRRPVDFGSLGSDELGSVYESLLELHPMIDTGEGPFTLGTASGNERKITGSYYTPTFLINCLLDSALDPVVHAAIDLPDRTEAERKLLNLKICDPACGSGHFLIAAAERMAMHLARLRTGDDEPNTLDVQHAKRDIIGRCIYGVDINPMAVELCKVALWMDTLDPGRPLSFLDHHIQCGNSLIGTTPTLLKKGIPNNAFSQIEGDVKAVCSELERQNKREHHDRERGQGIFDFAPYIKLGNLPSEFSRLTSASDDSVTDRAKKERRYAELTMEANYLNARLLADLWCAVFVWKKDNSDIGRLCPTENDFRRIENNPYSILPHVKSEVQRLAAQYQFFHWHLVFPDVFWQPKDNEIENVELGWNRGFDVVIGNPPWERIGLKEKEFFSEKNPDVAAAATASERRKRIVQLESSDPLLFGRYLEELRKQEGISHFCRSSDRFPLCGYGRDINSSAVFSELAYKLIDSSGRTGILVPTATITDSTTKLFFQELMESQRIVSAFDFENRNIFQVVHSSYKFCLLTLIRSVHNTPSFAFYLHDASEAKDPRLRFVLTEADILSICPNTRTCPVFRSRNDAELAKKVYRRLPILLNENVTSEDNWSIRTRCLFDMTNDSHLFSDAGNSETCPLYEAKMVHQFDHRWFSFGVEATNRRLDPTFVSTPRYWVPLSEVERRTDVGKVAQFVIRRITRATDERTVITTVIPKLGTGNSLLHIVVHDADAAQLNGALNSLALDYFARQKVAGTNLNPYILRQFPVLSKTTLNEATPWFRHSILGGWLIQRILELTYTAWDLETFASNCGYSGPPFRWDEERRFLVRCELDAAYFLLYLGPETEWGNDSPQLNEMFPTPRHALEYIMDTFPIVRRKDIAKHGTYRTKDTILEIYDAMQTAIRTGIPYQTPLTPPPGPPTDANGQPIPFAQWTNIFNTSHIHPPREAAAMKPQVVVVDPLFPQTDLEKVLCACLLDLVTSQPSLTEDDYVDLMILAMQPANCRLLLTGDDRDRFDQSLKAVKPELIADSDGTPPWRLLLSTLRANQSIQLSGHALLAGEKLKAVRRSLPQVDDHFLSLVAKAGERLRELQETATPDATSAAVVEASRNRREAAMAGAPGK